ncbi:hypothetical protein SAMN04490244_104214 [Tranquillimonas rosea]|uniref:Uncharacterized protein n=2 Tax=Tranquillimonas rosea TaxID=641238 RepID=A0A1H9TKG9_9RHOB|nr:hypothetical protein SAMN04490244_104214 [Tranquillimonas rosea]
MIGRRLMRQMINKGVDAGIDKTLGAKKDKRDMSRSEREQLQASKTNSKRAKKGLRVLRKIGRF